MIVMKVMNTFHYHITIKRLKEGLLTTKMYLVQIVLLSRCWLSQALRRFQKKINIFSAEEEEELFLILLLILFMLDVKIKPTTVCSGEPPSDLIFAGPSMCNTCVCVCVCTSMYLCACGFCCVCGKKATMHTTYLETKGEITACTHFSQD